MGVRGLTTFISNRSSQYLENCELHDSYLVLDGNSIACQLYKWHSKCNDCFGGDYDKYANLIKTFFQLLFDCNIVPLIVFDGAYEQRKLKTVHYRMKNKLSAAKDLNSVTENNISVFPLFSREVFIDIILKLEIKCIRCEFEGDSEAASLAKNLRCPILSYDSDFYIYDVLYIPFSTMDLTLRRKKKVNYISCQIYKMDKFLNSFGGLDKVNLPLLAVLLGNDYINKSVFSAFFKHIKSQKSKGTEQQKFIKSIIMWLKNETPESALVKILGRFKLHRRKKIAEKIQLAIEAYQSSNSDIFDYFNIDLSNQEPINPLISIENLPDIKTIPTDEEIGLEVDEEGIDETSSEEEELEIEENHEIPKYFRDNYKKCLYPSSFMDMIFCQTYYCIPQIENTRSEHSHTISLNILSAINAILNKPNEKQLLCVSRNQHNDITKTRLPNPTNSLPSLSEIENMTAETRKKILFDVLNLNCGILDEFPSSWHLYLISIKYWIVNSQPKIDKSFLYSTILCAIMLNHIDGKVGFYRSTKAFLSKYSSQIPQQPDKKSENNFNNISEALNKIDLNNSISCLHKLINYFQMDFKMQSNVRLFDRTIIHEFAKFQSCILHIKYLNSLLLFPFEATVVSDFYDGTFLYNITANFVKRTDLKAYIQILLENSPRVLNSCQLIVDKIESDFGDCFHASAPGKKRRKRNKKAKEVQMEDLPVDEIEEEYEFDSNNAFSLLSFVNKDL